MVGGGIVVFDCFCEGFVFLVRDQAKFLEPDVKCLRRYAKAVLEPQQKFVRPVIRLNAKTVNGGPHGLFWLKECGGEVMGKATTASGFPVCRVMIVREKECAPYLREKGEVTAPGFVDEAGREDYGEVPPYGIVESDSFHIAG